MKTNFSEEEKTAACIMFGLAALLFEEKRPDVWWFKWCVEHSYNSKTSFESCVWWAIRMADEDIESPEEWLGYLEHVCRNRGYLRK